MISPTATPAIQHNPEDMKLMINSIQRTVLVERLPIPELQRSWNEIHPYDIDNLYPNKVKAITSRSITTTAAVNTFARFCAGQGDVRYNDTVINKSDDTLMDIIRHIGYEYGLFNGFALHLAYNVFGQLVDISPINFETIRWHRELNHLVYNRDWHRGRTSDHVKYDKYNEDDVVNQINQVGFEKYKGQILYYIKNRKDIYTTCRGDAALDQSQFESESAIYKLSNVQNGYSANMVMLYPSTLDGDDELEGLKKDIRGSRGGANAGKTKAIPMPASLIEKMGDFNMFQEIPRTGIDKLFVEQDQQAQAAIMTAFSQIPLLSGISKDGMFNQDSYRDAFHFYNSITESDRQDVERVLNKILSNSVYNINDLRIKPLELQNIETNGTNTNNPGAGQPNTQNNSQL